MQERRDGSAAKPGWGWFAAISLLLVLGGISLLVAGWGQGFMAGYSGKRPGNGPYVAATGCGVGAVLIAIVGWIGTKGRAAVRGLLLLAGLIGALVVMAGARGAYENRARPLAACRNWESPPTATSQGGENVLEGVAATSPFNAWAVGWCGSRTLVLHWDGST